MTNEERCVDLYRKYKNLKIVGSKLGIPWQTVYVILKRNNISVCGDKLRYGSNSDRLAAISERNFIDLVPNAINQNRKSFQSKIDFMVNGYGVDIKASNRKTVGKSNISTWAFSIKKQEIIADFFVCFAMENENIKYTLLIPSEISKNYSTIRIGDGKNSIKGKWWDFIIDKNYLNDFFMKLPKKQES